ncbi:uncharacterized protein A1O9_11848 [Exophiala aquamarina CBS 119918]|uniref:J domain-containing protein n=1 Tax=Exophiala aquamarina CBS 119918 TaxID=1182545 RepID=A0A072NXB6_9EURO|nr:uncharacterized protein A1O9_11848 [Exophiala aquamarina CBS 119918]KEF52221.1 hypothetical protein A1O9_11848 [Exophiala aquamarina CBS 119918]
MPEDLDRESIPDPTQTQAQRPFRDSSPHLHSKRFRFKTKRKHSEHPQDDLDHRQRRVRDHKASHRQRKRHKSSRDADDDQRAFQHSTSRLPPEQAFRESLFDALGDDEGAAFWEGVYGQPIHTYPNTYQDDETGELERMTDEEYAQFVRRKMWEKSWEGIEAAKEEKRQREQEKDRQRRRDNAAQENKPHDHDIFDSHIEASLRRGQQRKDRKRWQVLWQEYLRRWDELLSLSQSRLQTEEDEDRQQLFLRNKIAWPVESGKPKGITRAEVERFIRKGNDSSESEDFASVVFANTVKAERVRWHPDKIQQRYGFLEIDEGTLKGVTAVFQIFDDIWNDLRTRQSP